MKFVLLVSLLISINVSCNQKGENADKFSYRVIKKDNLIVKGYMSADTIFDGEIGYYIKDTLIGVRTFRQGISHGKAIDYFPNGKIKQISFDKNGLSDGEIIQFDSTENIVRTQFYYSGRIMGPQYFYNSKGSIEDYFFLNFDNDVICRLRYYPTEVKIIEGTLLYSTFTNLNIDGIDKLRIFFYVQKPQRILCNYTVGLISENDNSGIDSIDAPQTGGLFFEKDFPVISNKNYCIRLNIFDSVSNSGKVFIQIFKPTTSAVNLQY